MMFWQVFHALIFLLIRWHWLLVNHVVCGYAPVGGYALNFTCYWTLTGSRTSSWEICFYFLTFNTGAHLPIDKSVFDDFSPMVFYYCQWFSTTPMVLYNLCIKIVRNLCNSIDLLVKYNIKPLNIDVMVKLTCIDDGFYQLSISCMDINAPMDQKASQSMLLQNSIFSVCIIDKGCIYQCYITCWP